MAIYQTSLSINVQSSLGTIDDIYKVDTDNWDIGGGVNYSVSAQSVAHPAITAKYILNTSLSINIESSFSAKSIKLQISAIAQDYAADDSLALSLDEDGNWFATLDETYWSDLGETSVYAGFRLISGDGLAIINEDPQYHVRTVGVNIISPFSTWTMYSGQWHLYIPLGTDFNRSVTTPNYFRSSDLLTAVMSDARKFVVAESQYLTTRAGDLRKWNKIPAAFLDQLLATLGSYLRLDKLDSEGRRRLAFEWIRFLLYAGTEYFVDFLGYVYDTHFGIEALWTNDYRNFISYSSDFDNSYYPTNHVALTYKVEDWDIDDYDQWSLIIDTFYKLASVPLVLQTLAGKRHDNFDLFLIMTDHTGHDYFSFSPLLMIADTTLYINMVDHRYIKRESHAPLLQLNYTILYVVMVDHRFIERESHSPLLEI